MKKLVIASSNAGKLSEFKMLLAALDYEVFTQSELGVQEVAETATTFVENAIIKARNAAAQTGLPALADDSGIEVDALNGAPGVYSARFSAPNPSDDKNNALLVEKLAHLAEEERSARYRAVLVYMRHAEDPSPIICEGSWEGIIQLEPQGEGGFAYDPYFYLPTHGCTSAMLSKEDKNALSHRAKAFALLLERLRGL